MQKQEAKNELDILLPESDVVINGETIEIKPFPFSQLPKVINILSKIGAGIYSLFRNLQFNDAGNMLINQAFIEKIGPVIEEHFPEVVELIAIYTGKNAAFYTDDGNSFTGEDGLLLIVGIVERNYDFFMTRLEPEIAKIKAIQKK